MAAFGEVHRRSCGYGSCCAQSHFHPTGARGADWIFVDNQGLVESGGRSQGACRGMPPSGTAAVSATL